MLVLDVTVYAISCEFSARVRLIAYYRGYVNQQTLTLNKNLNR